MVLVSFMKFDDASRWYNDFSKYAANMQRIPALVCKESRGLTRCWSYAFLVPYHNLVVCCDSHVLYTPLTHHTAPWHHNVCVALLIVALRSENTLKNLFLCESPLFHIGSVYMTRPTNVTMLLWCWSHITGLTALLRRHQITSSDAN